MKKCTRTSIRHIFNAQNDEEAAGESKSKRRELFNVGRFRRWRRGLGTTSGRPDSRHWRQQRPASHRRAHVL